jgi:hypothetical protein
MPLVSLPTAARTPELVRAAALFCLSLIACLASVAVIAAEVSLALEPVSTHATGIFARSSAEVPAYCDASRRVFVVNAESGQVDVLAVSAEGALAKVGSIAAARDVPGAMQAVNSVAVSRGRLAVAVEADPPTAPGAVAFYDTATLRFLGSLPAGSLPDMVTFSPDGRWALVANEGESNHDATIDPEGTITVVDLAKGVEHATSRTVGFRDWNADGPRAGELPDLMARGLRHFGRVRVPGDASDSRAATFAEDVEPEWIEIDPESRTAYVSLQEANAIAVIDIARATVERIMPLGFKDHGVAGNELDTSDKDGGVSLRSWSGLYGVFQPDTIRLLVAGERRYLVTANEGDSRVRPYADGIIEGVKEGAFFTDEASPGDWPLDGTAFAAAAAPADLGRLKVVRDLVERHLDGQGRPTRLFAFGARSFSIFDATTGDLVFDSGADFERIVAERHPDAFNVSNDATRVDARSRSKGPEPEGLAIGTVEGRTFAFVGLERVGGVMVYDITDPARPQHVGFHLNRRCDVPLQLDDGSTNPAGGDSGPEGLIFVAAERSPTGRPLLIVGNETSGTTTVWQISARPAAE